MTAEYEDSLQSIRRRLNHSGSRIQQVREAGKSAISPDADESTIATFRGMIKLLENSYSKYDELWDELCDLKNPVAGGDSTPSQKDKEIRSSVDKYYCLANSYLEQLNMRQAERQSRQLHDITAAEITRRSLLPGDVTISQPRVSRSLPKIALPSFDGEILQWNKFRDTFLSLIHKDEAMSPIEKFHYLRTSLTGRALSVISHIELTADNYVTAWKAVEDAFNNPRLVASTHIEQVINFKPLQDRASADNLQTFLSGIGDSVAAFQNLKITDESSFLLFHLAVRCLDNTTRELFEMSNKNVQFPTYDSLIKFVQDRRIALQLTNYRSPQENQTSSHPFSGKRGSMPPRPRSFGQTSLIANKSPYGETSSSSSSCIICSGFHNLINCERFNTLSVDERIAMLKDWKGCRNCLNSAHSVQACTSKWHCRFCIKRHHSLLHKSDEDSATSAADRNQVHTASEASLNSTIAEESQVILGTAVVQILDARGHFQNVRIVVDSGSQNSFLTHRCSNKLGLQLEKMKKRISGIGQTPLEGTKGITNCVIRPRHARSTQLFTKAIVVSNITSFLPSTLIPGEFIKKCSSFQLADPQFWEPAQIEFLLGADLFPRIILGSAIPIQGSEACLIPTIFGHVVLGRIEGSTDTLQTTSLLTFTADDDLNMQLKTFWEIEEPLVPVPVRNPDDEKSELHFQSTHYRLPTGRYVVRLPFKDDSPLIGDSSHVALRRLYNLEKKLDSNTQLKVAYQKFMEEYQRLNHMSLATVPSQFLIPHHCVVKDDKHGQKLRVVFDASVKVPGGSLNDHLLTGQKLQNDIREVIMRFRRHPVVFTTDIVKMFRMIEVDRKDRKFQHIYWRENSQQPAQRFELHTVTYGLVPAPFLAQRVLKQLTLDHGNEHPHAAEVLLKDIYVDDILTGAETIPEAITLQQDLVKLLSKGEFELSKWNSNSSELLQTFSPLDHSKSNPVDISPSEDQWVKILGLQWDSRVDAFSFLINQPIPTFTKRGILSLVARLYDPLGFLTPTIFLLKGFIQELWKMSLDWDQSIPTTLADSWSEVVSELPLLSKVKVPRYLGISQNSICHVVGFSDASMKGYAAVIYLRVSMYGSWHISLLTSKSKLAPTKTISVPRLELSGAFLLAQLYKSVLPFLSSLKQSVEEPIFFTDSSIVLSWLATPTYKLQVFVANRVTQIHELIDSNSWRHVLSEDNPCDVASRGTLPSQLIEHELWWTGPSWLNKNEEDWPASTFEILDSLPEIKEPEFPVLASRIKLNPLIPWIERFSSFSSVIRGAGWLTRWFYNLKHVGCCCCSMHTGPLTKAEYDLGLEMCIKAVQTHHFSTHEMHQKYADLKPFLDPKGLWRVGGRLRHSSVEDSQKYPILLPYESHFTVILVDYFHTIYLHPGPTTLQAVIQTQYWIPSLRRLIRQRGFQCLKCYKSKANVIRPMMGDLPNFRVNGGRIFLHVGVDFAGPFPMKISNRRNSPKSKVYLCLYVCMTTKALHLEAVTRLTTEAFLASFQRFTSRRGIPSDVYTDCGSNFLGAASYLKELYHWFKSQDTKDDLMDYAMKTRITWHFNPPQTPHMGGIWEAGVRSVKRYLRLIGGDIPLTFEEISTWFAKIEAILNSRPLCPLSTSPEENNYLCPGHFLVGGPLVVAPEPSLLDIKENCLSKWQTVSRMSEEFWRRWSSEYLSTLQRRPKWNQPQRNLAVGDLVLLKEPSPPLHWKLAKVVQVHPGKDEIVRVATIQTSRSTYKRSAVNLVPLPHLSTSAYPNQF